MLAYLPRSLSELLETVESLFPVLLMWWAMTGNVLWYLCKAVLRGRGYPVSWFRGHWTDFPNMHRLIRRETDPARRRGYRVLLGSLYVVLGLFPVWVGLMIYRTVTF